MNPFECCKVLQTGTENVIEIWLTYIMAACALTSLTVTKSKNDPSRTDDKVDIFVFGLV